MSHLDGKVVLIAGATGGMGRALALRAASEGARVALFSRHADQLAEVKAQISRREKGTVVTLVGDACDEKQVTDAVRRTARTFGRIDVLANFVGTNVRDRSLRVLSTPTWRHMLVTNLEAAYLLTQAVLPTFREQQDGLLIHVSSSAAKKPDASGVAYQATKSGLVGLAHGTMEEERGNGVRVTVVFPGLTNTSLVNKRPIPPSREVLDQALQPDDIAQLCAAVMALPARVHVPEVLIYPSRLA